MAPIHYPTTSTTLLGKLQSGDEISWSLFAEKYRPVIIAIARLHGLSGEDCQDVFQESMKRFFQNSTTFRYDPNIARFRTYFCRIVEGKIIDLIRKKSRQREQHTTLENLDKLPDDTPTPQQLYEQATMDEWRKHVLQQCIELLQERTEPDTFQIFELYALQNRPPKDVADFFHCTVNHVYAVKNKCLEHLRSIYRELEQQDPDLELIKHGL